jgi:hypothetical protein
MMGLRMMMQVFDVLNEDWGYFKTKHHVIFETLL